MRLTFPESLLLRGEGERDELELLVEREEPDESLKKYFVEKQSCTNKFQQNTCSKNCRMTKYCWTIRNAIYASFLLLSFPPSEDKNVGKKAATLEGQDKRKKDNIKERKTLIKMKEVVHKKEAHNTLMNGTGDVFMTLNMIKALDIVASFNVRNAGTILLIRIFHIFTGEELIQSIGIGVTSYICDP